MLKNYKKNYEFSLPEGYAYLEGENKDVFHNSMKNFVPSDADYFFNKNSDILFVCFKGESFEFHSILKKDQLYKDILREARSYFFNIYKNEKEITIESIENINDFITVTGKSVSDIDDILIIIKMTLYPISKNSKTNAIFLLGMFIPLENKESGEKDLRDIMRSLKLTAYSNSERKTD